MSADGTAVFERWTPLIWTWRKGGRLSASGWTSRSEPWRRPIPTPQCVEQHPWQASRGRGQVLVHHLSHTAVPHWLPIPLRIKYKVNLLTFKALHGLGPSYLSGLLVKYAPELNLRSQNQGLLTKHKFKLQTYGHRAYFNVALSYWNEMMFYLRFENELGKFKSGLKTYLFKLFTQSPESYVF